MTDPRQFHEGDLPPLFVVHRPASGREGEDLSTVDVDEVATRTELFEDGCAALRRRREHLHREISGGAVLDRSPDEEDDRPLGVIDGIDAVVDARHRPSGTDGQVVVLDGPRPATGKPARDGATSRSDSARPSNRLRSLLMPRSSLVLPPSASQSSMASCRLGWCHVANCSDRMGRVVGSVPR